MMIWFYAFQVFASYAWWFISRSRGPLQPEKVSVPRDRDRGHGADTYLEPLLPPGS